MRQGPVVGTANIQYTNNYFFSYMEVLPSHITDAKHILFFEIFLFYRTLGIVNLWYRIWDATGVPE